jgi:hypothetical protein
MRIERARFYARISAPDREVALAGRASGQLVKLFSTETPVDPIQFDIARQDILELDDQGGLQLQLTFSDQIRSANQGEFHWRINSLQLEVIGETLPRQ